MFVEWVSKCAWNPQPPDCSTKPCTMESPNPVPWPCGLVVKNGSNIRLMFSWEIPLPESVTDIAMYSPAGRSARVAIRSLSSIVCVVMEIAPRPSGIASRALIAKLSSELSNWAGSIRANPRFGSSCVMTVMAGPTERLIRSTRSPMSTLMSVG